MYRIIKIKKTKKKIKKKSNLQRPVGSVVLQEGGWADSVEDFGGISRDFGRRLRRLGLSLSRFGGLGGSSGEGYNFGGIWIVEERLCAVRFIL